MSGKNRSILPSTILSDNGSKTIVGDSNVDNSVPVSKKSKSPSIMVSNLTPSVLQILLSAVSKDTDDGGEGDGGRSTRGEHERKSHLFCGCCCDLVRACVVTNSVYIALMVFWVLVSVLELPMYQSFRLYNRQPANDDDGFEDDDDDEFLQDKSGMEWREILTIARTAFGILFAALGIWGASKFHRGLTASPLGGAFSKRAFGEPLLRSCLPTPTFTCLWLSIEGAFARKPTKRLKNSAAASAAVGPAATDFKDGNSSAKVHTFMSFLCFGIDPQHLVAA